MIPSKKSDMIIFGYRINQTPAEVTENLGDDLDKEWPNLNDTYNDMPGQFLDSCS